MVVGVAGLGVVVFTMEALMVVVSEGCYVGGCRVDGIVGRGNHGGGVDVSGQ